MAAISRNAHRLDDISKIRTEDVTESTEKRSFSDLHLSPNLIKGLHDAGFKSPSPVQWSALPMANLGVDLVVQAKSGTGKTLVFVVAALNMVNVELHAVQVVLIAPTREIAVQCARACLDVAKGAQMDELKVHTFIGGMSLTDDMVKAKRCQIAVGTPGRLRDLIKSKHIKSDSVRLFVLDEADKLMEPSFKADLTFIFNSFPDSKQIIALSATYPTDLEAILAKFMSKPQHIRLNPKSQVLVGVTQFALKSPNHPLNHMEFDLKFKILLEIMNKISFSQCLIFSNYSVRAESICEKLEANGWPVLFLAGTMDQRDRLRALNSLKQFSCRVLITTDLSARGIDAANVNLVINMEVPWEGSTYMHRIGRSGRFGSYGIALTIASESTEMTRLQEIVFETGSPIHMLPKNEESGEYEIPDLWKLKQNEELESLLPNLSLLEGIEAPVKVKSEVDQDDPNTDQQQSLNDNFSCESSTKKIKKVKKRGKKKNDAIDEEVVEDTGIGAWQTVQAEQQQEHVWINPEYEYNYEETEQYQEYDHYYGAASGYSDNFNACLQDDQAEQSELIISDVIGDTFLVEQFEESVGYKLLCTDIISDEKDFIEEDLKAELELILDEHCSRQVQEVDEWPIDLTKVVTTEPSKVISDEIKNKVSRLSKQLLNERLEDWNTQVSGNKSVIKNANLSELIEDLLNGKSLETLQISVKDEFAWQPVDYDPDTSAQAGQLLFDGSEVKVELDDDYFDQDNYETVADQTLTDDAQGFGQEDPEQPWDPFPNPDSGLPAELRNMQKDEWLRLQYQLWLQKVQENREMVEFHAFQNQ